MIEFSDDDLSQQTTVFREGTKRLNDIKTRPRKPFEDKFTEIEGFVGIIFVCRIKIQTHPSY